MTINPSTNLHPDDILLFNEVAAAMRRVAKQYELPLTAITAYPMPDKGMADRLGECPHDGQIRLVLRATVNGVWEDAPRTPARVWQTAAHELSHLRHWQHGVSHQEFQFELEQALRNQQEDHQQKLLARLVKMQAARDGEAALGNVEAAEAFAGMINKLLIEHELHPSDLDYARATDQDPVIELQVNLTRYTIEEKKTRIAWQNTLARIVAHAHLCTYLVRSGSNDIWFVGTTSHATVAEYAYGVLVNATAKLSHRAYRDFLNECAQKSRAAGHTSGHWKDARGFQPSWLAAFIDRIEERFKDARQVAVADAPEGTSQALMRLNGALVKAQRFVDDKFKGRRRHAASIKRVSGHHGEGRARGRAAADAMTLGQKGVTGGGAPKALLKA